MGKRKGFATVVFVFLFVMMISVAAMAAKDPYKDVTKKKVDVQSYNAICYVKQHSGWRGISKKGKLRPNKFITRREFMVILYNFYGDRVPATVLDVKSANTGISSQFVCTKCVELSKILGYPIKWKGTNQRMTRKDVARYVKIFATYNAKFAPRR